jgi:AcrR family transcriptional regulator
MVTERPRGRRAGGEDTRAQILEAARSEFALKGYAAVSLRGIARAAGVDPRLIHHYFAGKSTLFAEVMEVGIDPAAIVSRVVEGPADRLGERIVRTFLTVWDAPDNEEALVGLIRTVLLDDPRLPQLRDYVVEDIVGRIVRAHPSTAALPPKQRRLRAGLIASQMLGLGVVRYLARIPEVADAPAEVLVERIAPVIQRHLEG